MVSFFVCLFVAVALAVVVVVSGGGAFFFKKWYKLDCIFLQSYVVNFPTLNKVLLTESLNFARKNFRVFRVFDFRKILEISTWKPPK